jgi:hypothetical protein
MIRGYYLIAAVLGFGLAAAILLLVRRDHLYLRDGVFWIVVAIVSLVFGLFPPLLDQLGALLGVAYSPALLFLIAIVVLVLRALLTDLALTAVRRDIRRLNQRIAMLDANLKASEHESRD